MKTKDVKNCVFHPKKIGTLYVKYRDNNYWFCDGCWQSHCNDLDGLIAQATMYKKNINEND